MRLVDSRSADGPGILALRDHRNIRPEVRNAILAATVTDRDADTGVYEVEDYGDIANASAWPKSSRKMPGWGFAWSVMAVRSSLTRAGTGGGGPPSTMIPVRGFSRGRIPDTRFKAWAMGYPPSWPSFPAGWSGIAIAGTDEDVQRLHWHPTDPRLVAPHRGVPHLSTIVTDCQGVEPHLAARLATHLFVVNRPRTESHGDDRNQGKKVGAWFSDFPGRVGYGGVSLRGVQRNVFGIGPDTLHFPQTPGFSASGRRLELEPHLGGSGDFVFGNQEENDGVGGGAPKGGPKEGQHDGNAPDGGAAAADPAAAKDAAGAAVYKKAYDEAIAAGKSSDEAEFIAGKARTAAGFFGPMGGGGAGGGIGGAGGAGAAGVEGVNGILEAGDNGSIGENSLAWLIGWSNGFHGGFTLDTEPPSPVGRFGRMPGPLTLAGTPDHGELDFAGGKGNLIAGGGGFWPIGLLGTAPNPAVPLFGGAFAKVAKGGLGQGIGGLGQGIPPVDQSVPLLSDAIPVPAIARDLDFLGIRVGKTDGKKIVAMVSANYGGFLHSGDPEDEHNIGKDADGNPINPAHISMNALYYFDHEHDGPLDFVKDYYSGYLLDYVVACSMAFNGRSGRWGWWASAQQEVVEKDEEPPYTPPTRDSEPPTRDPRRPTTFAIGMGQGDHAYSATARESSFAVILGRPQSQMIGTQDFRVSSPWASDDRDEALRGQRRTPIVFRLEAFGSQKDDWSRTHPELDLYRGGTAPGGVVFMPPESRVEELNPPGLSRSEPYWIFAPGTRMGFGSPVLSTGKLGSGWSERLDGANLVFATHAADGTPTDRLLILEASGHVSLKQFVANKSIRLVDSGANTVFEIQGTSKLAFYGATPAVKPTVSGSRADPEGALKDLLAELATLGLITDSSTA